MAETDCPDPKRSIRQAPPGRDEGGKPFFQTAEIERRFHPIVIGAHFLNSLTELGVAHRTKHDNWEIGRCGIGAHAAKNFQSVDSRHHHI